MNEFEKRVRNIAEILYKTSGDPHDHSHRAIWDDDSWEINTNSPIKNGVKNEYYNKALKFCSHYESVEEVRKMIRFINDVNPKLLEQMINEL